MKYIKTYESIKKTPEVGDYVICSEDSPGIKEFIENSVGQVSNTIPDVRNTVFMVKYENIPEDYKLLFDHLNQRVMFIEDIIHIAKNKKDLYIYLDQNKYNL